MFRFVIYMFHYIHLKITRRTSIQSHNLSPCTVWVYSINLVGLVFKMLTWISSYSSFGSNQSDIKQTNTHTWQQTLWCSLTLSTLLGGFDLCVLFLYSPTPSRPSYWPQIHRFKKFLYTRCWIWYPKDHLKAFFVFKEWVGDTTSPKSLTVHGSTSQAILCSTMLI